MLMLSSNSHPLLYSYTMHRYASNMIGSLQQLVRPLVALSAVVRVHLVDFPHSALPSLNASSLLLFLLLLRVVVVLAVVLAGDAINCLAQGVLRGAGRPGLGAILNIVGYW